MNASQCFIDQYDNFTYPQLRGMVNASHEVLGGGCASVHDIIIIVDSISLFMFMLFMLILIFLFILVVWILLFAFILVLMLILLFLMMLVVLLKLFYVVLLKVRKMLPFYSKLLMSLLVLFL